MRVVQTPRGYGHGAFLCFQGRADVLLRTANGKQVCGDVPRFLFGYPEIRHGAPRLDTLRIHEKRDHVLRSIGSGPGDERSIWPELQARSITAVCPFNAWNIVAATTIVGADQLGAVNRVSAWHLNGFRFLFPAPGKHQGETQPDAHDDGRPKSRRRSLNPS
jgi:hypothetical protein